ncbi:MAG TPA: hypothetical protein VMU39_17360 [Solirubrobacteraceae bacterium]|nr:hypothetical protein [Solirubrobacteraceae bacterium]
MGSLGGVNLLSLGAGVVRLKVFALFLGPAGMAVVGLASTFFDLLATACRTGVPTGLVREMARHIAEGNAALAWRVLRDARRLLALLGVMVAAACVGLPAAVLERLLGVALPRWFFLSLCVALPSSVLASGAEAGLNAIGAIRDIALVKAITVCGGLLVAVLLVALLRVDGGVAQVLTAAALSFVVTEFFLNRRRERAGNNDAVVGQPDARAAIRQVLGVGGAQFIYHLAVAANRVALRGVAANWLGITPAGFLQATLAVSQQYTVAVSAGLFVYLYPRFSSQLRDPGAMAAEGTRTVRFLLAVLVPSACVQEVFRGPGVALVLSPQFAPVAALLALTIPADLLFLVGTVPRTAMLAQGRAREYVALGVGGEAVRLAAFAVGLALRSLSAAIAGLLVAEFGILVVLVLRTRPRSPDQTKSWGLLGGGLLVVGWLSLVQRPLVAIPAGVIVAAAWLWCSRASIRAGVQ